MSLVERDRQDPDTEPEPATPKSPHATSEPRQHRRDSTEDGDASLTRKRPRLDSDSRAARRWSVDQLSPSPNHITAPHTVNGHSTLERDVVINTPSKVTLNVRAALSQSSSSRLPESNTDNTLASSPSAFPTGDPMNIDQSEVRNPQTTMDATALVGESLDAKGPDHDRSDSLISTGNKAASDNTTRSRSSTTSTGPVIALVEEEEEPEHWSCFDKESFPLFQSRLPLTEAAKNVTQHFGGGQINIEILHAVAAWIEDHLRATRNLSEQWPEIYDEEPDFWDELGISFGKLASRPRFLVMPVSHNELTALDATGRYTSACIRLASRWIDVDARRSTEWTEGLSKATTDLSSKTFLRAIAFMFDERHQLRLLINDQALYPSLNVPRILDTLREFFFAKTGGFNALIRLATGITAVLADFPQLWQQLTCIVRICVGFTQLCVRVLDRHPVFVKEFQSPDGFTSKAVQIFQIINTRFQEFVDKQMSALSTDMRKELFAQLGSLLRYISSLSPGISAALFREIVGPDATYPSQFYPWLNDIVWKLHTSKQCITKGKMEIRVLGVDIIAENLVIMHKEEGVRAERDGESPVLGNYVSEVLIKEQIINYIVGVDSHPTLISRGGNIVGLLMVTNTFGAAEIDVVWNTIANSPDPRVVSACLRMLSTPNIISLMNARMLLYFCRKLEALHIEALSGALADFWHLLNYYLLTTCSHRYHDTIQSHGPWMADDLRMSPYDLCVRVMVETFPGKCQTSACKLIHGDAVNELYQLVRHGPPQLRAALFGQLLQETKQQSLDTGANTEILHSILQCLPEEDFNSTADSELGRTAVENLCSFVQAQKEGRMMMSEPVLLAELAPRLDLVVLLVQCRPRSIPEELRKPLWDAMVGADAVSYATRDAAWYKLADVARPQTSRHEFFDVFLSEYLPSLPCEYYTPQLYGFMEKGIRFQVQEQRGTKMGEDGLIVIPSEELMWHVMLSAPVNTVEDGLTKLLAAAYDQLGQHATLKTTIEAKHIAVAKRCIKEMVTAAMAMRTATEPDTDAMGTTKIAASPEPKIRFQRTINFLGTLLQSVRNDERFVAMKRPELESGPDLLQESFHQSLGGNSLVVKFQAFNGHDRPIQSIEVDDLETRRQLYSRFAQLTGFRTFETILSGCKFDLLEKPEQSLREWGRATTGLIMIKQQKNLSHSSIKSLPVGRCALEIEVLQSFDDLYSFLDNDDELSRLTYEFLAKFPAHESEALLSVSSSAARPEDVFPKGKVYKTRYSIRCLGERLQSQIQTNIIEAAFVEASLKLLSEALTTDYVASADGTKLLDNITLVELVQCFRRFLVGAPDQTEDLSNPEELVSRLVSILNESVTSRLTAFVTCDTYDALLEACLHSKKIWEAFRRRDDIEDLHHSLLFADAPMTPSRAPKARESVAELIKEKLTSRPKWQRIPAVEMAVFFWKILCPLIARTPEHPECSQDLFKIANSVFNLVYGNLDADNERVHDDLSQCFQVWSALLLAHDHQEFVGRDECDPIVFGLARLLNSCLGQTSRIDGKEEFVAEVFNRLLFPRLLQHGEYDLEQPLMPVLHSGTRHQLYSLLIALSEDSESLKSLAEYAQDALCTDGFHVQLYHRRNLLRAPTGLVGIKNLGNTCYMNALLTQLFMNVPFRHFILSLPVVNDNTQMLLADMKRLFSQMQEGWGKCVDATCITQSVRTFEGEPIDVSVQMDVEEFENLLIDQLEGQILDPKDRQKFRSFYGGHVVNQIKSKECEHVSERLEPYFAVQCDVKGKTSLRDSLQAFVEGDAMEGDNKYKCEACGGRLVNAVKRTCLKDVPDSLIFHLKRFDFDVGTMQRSKINDLFEFPMNIDVSPYKVEHLENPDAPIEPDHFDLVGVLLHKGVAEHGHYFSYIRSRPSVPGEEPKWILFDDADVTEFNPSEIKEKCYGGWMEAKDHTLLDGTMLQKPYNGYMLFYERANKTEQVDAMVRQPFISGPPKVEVPRLEAQLVAFSNQHLLRLYTCLDPVTLDFVLAILNQGANLRHLCGTGNHDLERRVLRTALQYLHLVAARTKETPAFEKFCRAINCFIGDCTECHVIVYDYMVPRLSAHARPSTVLLDLTVRSTVVKVRSAFRALFMDILMHLREHLSEEVYGTVTSENNDFDPGRHIALRDSTSVISRFAKTMSVNFDNLAMGQKSWDDFFGLLATVAGLGLGEVATLLDNDILRHSLELLMLPQQNCRPSSLEWEHIQKLIQKRRFPFDNLIELVHMLTDCIDFSRDAIDDDGDRAEEARVEDVRFALSVSELDYFGATMEGNMSKNLILVMNMFDRFDSSRAESLWPAAILQKLVYSDGVVAKDMLYYHTIKNALEGFSASNQAPFLDAAHIVCAFSADEDVVKRTFKLCVGLAVRLDENPNLGLGLVNFFDHCLQTENERIEAEYLPISVVRFIHDWAPPLLFALDHEWRDAAWKLVMRALTQPGMDDDDQLVDAGRVDAVRKLSNFLLYKVHIGFGQRFGKKALYHAVATLVECGKFFAEFKKAAPAAVGSGADADVVRKIHDVRLIWEEWDGDDDDAAQSVEEDWPSDLMTEDDM